MRVTLVLIVFFTTNIFKKVYDRLQYKNGVTIDKTDEECLHFYI